LFYSGQKIPIEAPCTKVQGIFHERKMSIYWGTIPLDPAIRAEYFGRKAFAKIQGIMSPLLMVSSATGPILAGYLFDVSGSYRSSFLITALIAFGAVECAFFFPRLGRGKV
jgi:MFS family permease